jgi:transcriptional regulator with XRE-family HTH domain
MLPHHRDRGLYRILRKAKGHTQEDLAWKLGIRQALVSQIELGKRPVPFGREARPGRYQLDEALALGEPQHPAQEVAWAMGLVIGPGGDEIRLVRPRIAFAIPEMADAVENLLTVFGEEDLWAVPVWPSAVERVLEPVEEDWEGLLQLTLGRLIDQWRKRAYEEAK